MQAGEYLLTQSVSVQILSVDEMGEGIKPIRPQSLVDMMKVPLPIPVLCVPPVLLYATDSMLSGIHGLWA